MPKKLDLSDRYARGGQRRPRRRTPSVAAPEARRVATELPAAIVPAEAGPARVTTAPIGRPAPRARSVPQVNYSYVRSDLTRIGVVVAILLVIMAILFFILR